MSVLCGTNKPGRVVYNGLKHYKGIADEIVLAADSKVGAEDLGWYAAAATKLMRFEFIGTDRHWPWMMQHITTDWVLLVDGDELPSQELLDRLPGLMEDRGCDVWSMPVRWCYPDAEHYLNQEPWRSHYGPRLRRNTPTANWLSGAVHQNSLIAWPHSTDLSSPIYHLDLPSQPYQARKEKVARYDQDLGGHMTYEGEPHNIGFYLPEEGLSGDPELAKINPIDSKRIAEALYGTSEAPAPVDPDSIPLSDREEIMKYHPDRLMQKDKNSAKIIEHPWRSKQWVAGNLHHALMLEIHNTGEMFWPGGTVERQPAVYGQISWEIEGHKIKGTPFALDRPLKPGEFLQQQVTMVVPDYVGEATLIIRIRSADDWFGEELRKNIQIQPGASQRLKELSNNKMMVSVEDALKVRKEVSSLNGLTNSRLLLGEGQRPTEQKVVDLISELPDGGMGIDSDTIDLLQLSIRKNKPENIIALGSGASTLVIADMLKEMYGDRQVRLISFEPDLLKAEKTLDQLQAKGLDQIAVVAPLTILPDDNGRLELEVNEKYIEAIAQRKPEMCILRTPEYPCDYFRGVFLNRVKGNLANRASVMIDDGFADAQLELARLWQSGDEFQIEGIWMTPKGMLQATYRR